jgi:hypothetical protein
MLSGDMVRALLLPLLALLLHVALSIRSVFSYGGRCYENKLTDSVNFDTALARASALTCCNQVGHLANVTSSASLSRD